MCEQLEDLKLTDRLLSIVSEYTVDFDEIAQFDSVVKTHCK